MAPYVTAEDVYIGQLAGSLQGKLCIIMQDGYDKTTSTSTALNSGVTTILDHFHAANSVEHIQLALKALVESGLRVLFCPSPQVGYLYLSVKSNSSLECLNSPWRPKSIP